MPAASCPKCEEDVYVKADLEQGTLVSCDECGESLELVGLDPIELDPHTEPGFDEYADGFNVYDREEQ